MTNVPSTPDDHARERGQVIVIFAGGILLFVLLLAVVLDISWYWANTLRVQRAADAAALAGAVLLPGRVDTGTDYAYLRARNEATKNGYTGTGTMVSGLCVPQGSVCVTPVQDSRATVGGNPNQLNVTITAPVPTFFMRVIGISSITTSRSSKAEYALPVPMGSPQNYYGVGLLRDAIVTTTTTPGTSTPGDSGWRVATGAPSGGQWSSTSGGVTSAVNSNDNQYAYETTNNQSQQWRDFGLAIPNPTGTQTVAIAGIEVRLTDAHISAACATSVNRLSVDLSWNGGGQWSTAVLAPPPPATLPTSATSGDYTLGSAADTTAWGAHPWQRTALVNDFSDANFRVRLTAIKGCPTFGTQLRLDMLEVRVSYTVDTPPVTTTTTNIQNAGVRSPYGDILAPQNFWGAMQSQGAPNIQGDAYMTKYQSRSGLPANPAYGWDEYYNYGVEMPAGATDGEVWIFDPGFCDVTTTAGTGENWTVGGAERVRKPSAGERVLRHVRHEGDALQHDRRRVTALQLRQYVQATLVRGLRHLRRARRNHACRRLLGPGLALRRQLAR